MSNLPLSCRAMFPYQLSLCGKTGQLTHDCGW
nr:MAG TPA_asm: hypothetical protein [Caudoviricetes sp.]DAL51570.1 MAG TPA_asm: hypothetical protein [Caudoviricetes sp.]